MNIAGVRVGMGHPCRVTAEISNNHNGSIDVALRLIRESAEAGADLLKFQAYTPDELVALRGDGPAPDPWGSEGWSMVDLYFKAQTPPEWFPYLVGECSKAGVPWFSSVFGPDSLDMLESLDCPAYKIAALDEGATGLRRHVKDTGKPIVASTARSGGPGLPWADLLLHCPPGYPQDPGAIDMGSIRLGGYDGLSYHGTDWLVPARAVKLGAAMVEVHVQLDDTPSELEADVSLTTRQLRRLCVTARATAEGRVA